MGHCKGGYNRLRSVSTALSFFPSAPVVLAVPPTVAYLVATTAEMVARLLPISVSPSSDTRNGERWRL